MKAPPFTAENAAEMARRAQISRKRNKEAAAAALSAAQHALAEVPASAIEDDRTKRVLIQIDRVDDLLMECDPDQFPALCAAKERLWNLVLPKAGVMRPRQSGRRGGGPASLPPPVPE